MYCVLYKVTVQYHHAAAVLAATRLPATTAVPSTPGQQADKYQGGENIQGVLSVKLLSKQAN